MSGAFSFDEDTIYHYRPDPEATIPCYSRGRSTPDWWAEATFCQPMFPEGRPDGRARGTLGIRREERADPGAPRHPRSPWLGPSGPSPSRGMAQTRRGLSRPPGACRGYLVDAPPPLVRRRVARLDPHSRWPREPGSAGRGPAFEQPESSQMSPPATPPRWLRAGTTDGYCLDYRAPAGTSAATLEAAADKLDVRLGSMAIAGDATADPASGMVTVELKPGPEDLAAATELASGLGATGALEFLPVPPELQGSVGEGPLPEGMQGIEPLFDGSGVTYAAVGEDEMDGRDRSWTSSSTMRPPACSTRTPRSTTASSSPSWWMARSCQRRSSRPSASAAGPRSPAARRASSQPRHRPWRRCSSRAPCPSRSPSRTSGRARCPRISRCGSRRETVARAGRGPGAGRLRGRDAAPRPRGHRLRHHAPPGHRSDRRDGPLHRPGARAPGRGGAPGVMVRATSGDFDFTDSTLDAFLEALPDQPVALRWSGATPRWHRMASRRRALSSAIHPISAPGEPADIDVDAVVELYDRCAGIRGSPHRGHRGPALRGLHRHPRIARSSSCSRATALPKGSSRSSRDTTSRSSRWRRRLRGPCRGDRSHPGRGPGDPGHAHGRSSPNTGSAPSSSSSPSPSTRSPTRDRGLRSGHRALDPTGRQGPPGQGRRACARSTDRPCRWAACDSSGRPVTRGSVGVRGGTERHARNAPRGPRAPMSDTGGYPRGARRLGTVQLPSVHRTA